MFCNAISEYINLSKCCAIVCLQVYFSVISSSNRNFYDSTNETIQCKQMTPII